MIVGILKEIKVAENRVCMTPAGVEDMCRNEHIVLVETQAGVGSGFSDTAYLDAGAEIVTTPEEVYRRAEMVMHVKEPQPSEYSLIREGQIVFTYFHFAAEDRFGVHVGEDTVVGIAGHVRADPLGAVGIPLDS